MSVLMHVSQPKCAMLMSKDKYQEWTLFFHCEEPKNRTYIVKFANNHFYSMSHIKSLSLVKIHVMCFSFSCFLFYCGENKHKI